MDPFSRCVKALYSESHPPKKSATRRWHFDLHWPYYFSSLTCRCRPYTPVLRASTRKKLDENHKNTNSFNPQKSAAMGCLQSIV